MTVPSSPFAGLGLDGWPFQLVPLAEATNVWHDRAALKADLDRLLWRLTRQQYSTLHLIWADVGSGKTHTLRYMEYRAGTAAPTDVRALYSVMPRSSRSFVDLYSAATRPFDLDLLASVVAELRKTAGDAEAAAAVRAWPDLLPALALYESGTTADRELVRRWIAGSRDIAKGDLRQVGVSQQVRTSDDAVAALTAMTGLYLRRTRRLIMMIDELQRIGQVRTRVANEISSGLHTWFNAIPQGLTLVLAFSFGDKRHVDSLLTPELVSRADHQRLEMPLLSRDDALTFVGEAVSARLLPNAVSPIPENVVTEGILALAGRAPLTPRNIMKAFDAILTEIDFRAQSDGSRLRATEVQSIIADLTLDKPPDDS